MTATTPVREKHVQGLKRRAITPIDPTVQSRIEEYARRCDDWQDRRKTTCESCQNQWWRPSVAPPTARRCKYCCTHEDIRGYMRKSNGGICPQVLCVWCGRRADISRRDMDPILDVCLRDNIAKPLWRLEPCARCGVTTGSELHHWAPRAIFNDADDWPMAWLCPECHRTWHQAMRQAAGRSLPIDQRIGESPWSVA